MARIGIEWDPSWDDDWLRTQAKLEDEIEEEHPKNPAEAVEYYRYGFGVAKKHPTHTWPDAESEMYQDYMSGEPEPGEIAQEEADWRYTREWAHRGWEAARTRGAAQ